MGVGVSVVPVLVLVLASVVWLWAGRGPGWRPVRAAGLRTAALHSAGVAYV